MLPSSSGPPSPAPAFVSSSSSYSPTFVSHSSPVIDRPSLRADEPLLASEVSLTSTARQTLRGVKPSFEVFDGRGSNATHRSVALLSSDATAEEVSPSSKQVEKVRAHRSHPMLNAHHFPYCTISTLVCKMLSCTLACRASLVTLHAVFGM